MSEQNNLVNRDLFDTRGEPPGAALAAAPLKPGAAMNASASHVTIGRMWARRGLILSVFAAAALPGAIAAWFMHKPMYEAQGALYIEPTKPTIAFKDDDNQVFHNYMQYRNDQAANLRSPAVLNRVLDSERIRATNWFNNKKSFALGGEMSRLEILRDELEVSTPRDSSFVYLAMRCEDPAEAALIVNATLRECLEYVANEYDSDEERILSLQEKNAEKLELDLRMLKTDIADLLESSGLYTENPQALVKQKALRIDTKRSELAELKRELEVVRHRLERRNVAASDGDENVEPEENISPAFAADPVWRRLNEGVAEAEFALEVGGRRLGESNPSLLTLQTAAEQARKRLADYEGEMQDLARRGGKGGGGGPTPALSSGEYVEDVQYQIAKLQAEIDAEVKDLRSTNARVRELEERQEELARVNERLSLYRQRAYARKAERQAPPWIKERPAVEPRQSVNAKKRYAFVAMAFVFGAGLSLATAYWLAGRNQAIYTIAEVLDPAESSFLGYLPRVRDPKAMTDAEECVQAEHVRMIRTALLEKAVPGEGLAVLITSAGAGAGKTTVAWRLSRSLAQCGKRVLLIDADLRNPSLSTRYLNADDLGLAGVLSGQTTDADAIVAGDVPNLYVLSARKASSPSEPELLAGPGMRDALRRWRSEYDVVLLDTAPLMPVADTRILTRHVDGAVLVLRAEHCRRDEIFEAMSALNSAGARVLGTIFVGEGRRNYYGSYYSNYYQLACAGGVNAPNS